MQARIDTAFRILADIGIPEESIEFIVAHPHSICFQLTRANGGSMQHMVAASVALGKAPGLMQMDTSTLESKARLALDEDGILLLMADVNGSAQHIWPAQFSDEFNRAMILEQMEDDANKAPF